MSISSPVRGFRPFLAFLVAVENDPNPMKVTFSSRVNESSIVPNVASRLFFASD
jgi:hypothetical protein